MITEAILTPILLIFTKLLSGIPVVELIVLPVDLLIFLSNIIAVCGYFLPLGDMFIMFGIWIGYTLFRINFNFIKTIWEYVPFVH